MTETTSNFKIEELKEACIHSYAVFCEILQDDGWFDQVHLLLCNWVQKHVMAAEEKMVADPNEIFDIKLQVTLPRGALKSTIVTKYLAIWLTIRQYYLFENQGVRSLIVTNTFTNAKKKLRDIRGLFDSNQLFKKMFPEMLPTKKCRWTDEGAEINRNVSFPEATFECAGTGTKLTGRHFNLILEDDTTAPDEDEMKVELTTPSRETVEKAIGFHRASTPLYVPKGLRFSFVVTTRWAEEDIVDYVRDVESYKYFDMPALNSKGERNFSMFYSQEALEEIKTRVGEYMFSCLYLNVPLDASLRVFKEEWFQWIDADDVPNEGGITISIDPAASKKEEACETSITVVQHVEKGKRQYQYWWEDINGHLSFEEQVTTTIDKAIWYNDHIAKVEGIVVETVAYQAALEYMLMQEMTRRERYFDLIPFNSHKDKLVRIEGMQPLFFRERIFFVKKSLSDQVTSQLKQFPNGKLLDTIDSFSMHKILYSWDKADGKEKPKKESDADTFYRILEENRRKKRTRKGGMSTGLNELQTTFASMDNGLSYTANSGYYR